jgi:hypothetical protein
MGASCPKSARGLIGSHAYSLLEVRQLSGVRIGEQLKLDRFFHGGRGDGRGGSGGVGGEGGTDGGGDSGSCGGGGGGGDGGDGGGGGAGPLIRDGTLRVVRLRNPHGKREWKGAFGARAEQWTAALRRELGQRDTDDGTFWISNPKSTPTPAPTPAPTLPLPPNPDPDPRPNPNPDPNPNPSANPNQAPSGCRGRTSWRTSTAWTCARRTRDGTRCR